MTEYHSPHESSLLEEDCVEMDEVHSLPIKSYVEMGTQTDESIQSINERHQNLLNALKSVQQRADRQAKSIISLQFTVTSLKEEVQKEKNRLGSGIMILQCKFCGVCILINIHF